MDDKLFDKMMFTRLAYESGAFEESADVIELASDDADKTVSSIIRPQIDRGYVVSPNVTSETLERLTLEGIRGRVSKDFMTSELYIDAPKSLENDRIEHNTKVKSFYNRNVYRIPEVSEFDTVVSEGYNPSMQLFLDTDMKMVTGYCAKTDSRDIGSIRALYNTVSQVLTLNNKSGVVIIKDQLKRSKRELMLIIKK